MESKEWNERQSVQRAVFKELWSPEGGKSVNGVFIPYTEDDMKAYHFIARNFDKFWILGSERCKRDVRCAVNYVLAMSQQEVMEQVIREEEEKQKINNIIK